MIEKAVEGAVKNRWLVIAVAILLGLAGAWAYTQLFIDAYPDISGVMVQISTSYPGRASEEVEQEVTIPLERTLASVPHVEIIRSRTIFGLSLVQLNFEPGVEDYWARNVVFQKMGEATLPADASPSMGSLSTAYGEIYRYQIVADKGVKIDPMELRSLQDWVVTPRLLRAQGVVEVANFGGLLKQYVIELDRDKLVRYGVKLQEIETALKANNLSGGGSVLQRGSTSIVIRGLGRLRGTWDMEKVFIKNSGGTPVFLKDVGKVTVGYPPRTGIFGKDDIDDGVEGVVRMLRGSNPSIVLQGINEAVQELNASTLPKGVHITPFYDRSTLIDDTLRTVIHNTALGIGLVVLVLFLFLGSSKVAFMVALTIPFSLLFALLLMKLTGIPISLLSIGAIDFGIIVDGAIIMCENMIRRLDAPEPGEKRGSFTETILDASRQVQLPMLFSMLIVIVAYTPLLLLRHIEGLLFRPMAITLCYALGGALLVALFLIPVLATFFFQGGAPIKESPLFLWVEHRYARWLPKLIRYRWRVFGSASVVMAICILGIFPRLGTEFLPYMDEGSFWVRASFPEGISMKENAYYSAQMRKVLREFQEVAFVTSQTGRSDSGTDPFPGNRVEMMVGLKPRSEWKDHKLKLDLEDALRERLHREFPTTRFNFTQPIIDSVTEDANGTSANIAVEIVGPSLETLRSLAEKTQALLRSVPGAIDVNIEQEGPQPQLQIRAGRTRLSRYQLSADAAMDVINTAVGGQPVSQVYEGERRIDLVTKYAPKFIATPEALGTLPVFNDMGEPVPLALVADINVVDGQTLIARANSKRRITVRSDIRGRAQGDFAADAQRHFAAEVPLPAGYSVAWMGMFENLLRARAHFALLIPLTVVIIFGLLFLMFRDVTMAARVLVVIPFSMIGSAVALWVRGMHVNVSVAVGLTTLFGVATMHGVVLVACINELREKGMGLDEAIEKGALLRLRPVLMTAMVAILGLLPASLATDIGSDVQRPIATVVVWGLISSACLTLLVLPALYHIVETSRFGTHPERAKKA